MDSGQDTAPPARLFSSSWSWCSLPEAGEVPASAKWRWEVQPDVGWCSTFDELRDLSEEGAAKAVLRLAPGEYGFPESGTATLPFAACVALDAEGPGLVSSGEAEVEVISNASVWLAKAAIPLEDAAGAAWRLDISTRRTTDQAAARLDGEYAPPASGDVVDASLCREPCDDVVRIFDGCAFSLASRERHTITFEGGQVELDLLLGEAPVRTAPAIVDHATVRLGETTVEQESYWDLWYNPTQHHVSRSARVVLPEPIDGVAAVQVKGMDPLQEDPPVVVELLDAEGAVLSTPAVTDEAWSRP